MNSSQITAIENNLPELNARANVDSLILFFHDHGAFDDNEYEFLKNEPHFKNNHERAAEFFKTIKGKDSGWALLENGLKNAKQIWLLQKLKDAEQAAASEPQVYC